MNWKKSKRNIKVGDIVAFAGFKHYETNDDLQDLIDNNPLYIKGNTFIVRSMNKCSWVKGNHYELHLNKDGQEMNTVLIDDEVELI